MESKFVYYGMESEKRYVFFGRSLLSAENYNSEKSEKKIIQIL